MSESQNLQSVPKGKRVRYLDWLKLISAWLVVFYHAAYYNLDYGFMPGEVYLPNLNRIVMCFASCSVPIFFLVNGALMFQRHRPWKELVMKACKILVLIGIWYVVRFPHWFFRTLIILYLLFPVLQFLRERRKWLLRILCGAVFLMPFGYNFLLMCLKGLALADVIPNWTGNMKVTGCFTMYSVLYFCMGPELVKREKWPLRRCFAWIGIGWSLVVTECVIYTNLYQAVWDGVNAAFPTVGAGALAVGVFMLVRRIPESIGNRFILWAGEGVLAVYLLHLAAIKLVASMVEMEIGNIVFHAFITCLICATCILVQKAAKRIPYVNWLFRI